MLRQLPDPPVLCKGDGDGALIATKQDALSGGDRAKHS